MQIAPAKAGAPIEQRAVDCLTRGIRYEYLPEVRSHAIEALQVHGGKQALPWLRNALNDESPGVRFAAEMALGTRRDDVSKPAMQKLLQTGTSSDRIGAIFALHRLGDTTHTGELARYLLEDHDVTARGNAALVLGRLGGEGSLRMLALALGDSNPAIRVNVLEAMALQGSDYAIDVLRNNAYGGIGAEEVFAINTLGMLRDRKFAELFRQRLESALHPESKLAAARSLGLLGDRRGYDFAVESLSYRTTESIEQDSAANRTRRVHEMAAQALGAIGDRNALPQLEGMMNHADDPRTQIAAAKAILDILRRSPGSPRPRGGQR
ncbi:MAG: HEAT repeat domain-containing protein [Phycisphaerales bacterium]|nr:HEAT repeat domain-containing protein [Phycisphaerales bacterium]